MLKKPDLIFPSDLVVVKRDRLEAVGREIGIENNGKQIDIVENICDVMKRSVAARRKVSDSLQDVVFAGRTSVVWYLCSDIRSLLDIEHYTERINEKTEQDIQIIGAVSNENEALIRFLVRSGTYSKAVGLGIQSRVQEEIVTVYVSFLDNFAEVRVKPSVAKKVIALMQKQCFRNGDSGALIRFENFNDRTAGDWADQLGGSLVEAISHPEALVKDLSQEKVQTILGVLEAINSYPTDRDIKALANAVDAMSDEFGDMADLQFTALVLAGMDKVHLGTEGEDLRNQILYRALEPHLSHLGGFIQFPVVENGVTNRYTVRIGIDSKSVYFITPATEEAISRLRTVALKLNESEAEVASTFGR